MLNTKPTMKKKALIIVPIAALSIALAASIYYGTTTSLPPSHLIGIIYQKPIPDSFDKNNQLVHFLHICIFVDDKQNDVKAGECRSYQVDKEDYEAVKDNDIVKATIMPPPARAMDIYEIYPGSGRYISNWQD